MSGVCVCTRPLLWQKSFVTVCALMLHVCAWDFRCVSVCVSVLWCMRVTWAMCVATFSWMWHSCLQRQDGMSAECSAMSARVGNVCTYICSHVYLDKQKVGRLLIALRGELWYEEACLPVDIKSALQHISTHHCNTLQHPVNIKIALQHIAKHIKTALQHAATHINTALQHVAISRLFCLLIST